MLSHTNFYAELHLQPTAGASEIRTAYRRAALLAHPDKGGSVAAFHSIAFAFEVLSCPVSRALYDRAREQGLKEERCQSTGRANAKHKTPSTVTPQHGFTSRAKRKREPTTSAASPAAKRQQMSPHPEQDDDEGAPQADDAAAGETDDPPPAPKQDIHGAHFHLSLAQLRTALQELAPVHRRAEIAQMPPHVRTELLNYMSCQHAPASAPHAAQSRAKMQRQRCQGESWSRGTDVRTLKHIHKTSYQAQLRIQHLRMYTRAQPDLDTAISHQMALVGARHALDAAGEAVWKDPRKFSNVFAAALGNAGTSPEELGLSVFIFMRADEWISRCTTITSPVMPLQCAVAAHSRLLTARQTSWPKLRAEWVLLMRQTQQARLQKLSLVQAEAVAEKARLGLLQRQLKRAVCAADRAIGIRCDLRQKVAKAQRRAATEKAAAAASQKGIVARKRQELWAARRRWYRWNDLTMEDILQGPLQSP